jgi:L-rhamnose isomerase
MSYRIPDALIAEENANLAPAAQAEDYAALGRRLERAGVALRARPLTPTPLP